MNIAGLKVANFDAAEITESAVATEVKPITTESLFETRSLNP